MSSPEAATLTVLRPGLCTLVVDRGRPRTRSLGVPVGGAADRFALAIGNGLVGNPPDAAALEITLAGPKLRADADVACVLHGAPFEIASDRQALEVGKTFTLHVGEELHVGGTPRGMRGYLCVRGGLQTPVVLGSRSSFEPLPAGAELPCLPGRIHARRLHLPGDEAPVPAVLRVLDGPQADWFRAEEFYDGPGFQVSPASNRMGLRLHGRPLTVPARELVSEPVYPGAVQVTRDGQCIVLGVDGQTIGGYPKIAQVIAADRDRLAQLRPGTAVAFVRVSLEEAERLFRERESALRQWMARLQNAEEWGGLPGVEG
jgi:antagonist of KipI